MSEFNKMMQEAMELKKADIARRQVKFKSHPMFLQHTLYVSDKEEHRKFRYRRNDITLSQRLDNSLKHKADANELMGKGEYARACLSYEYSIGCFYYIHSKNLTWRTNGFGDDDLQVVWDVGAPGQGLSELGFASIDYAGEIGDDGDMSETIVKHVITCMCNVALARMHLKEYGEAVITCNEVLRRDSKNQKALFRKAASLTTPASCTDSDIKEAIVCLQSVLAVDPQCKEASELLISISQQLNQDYQTKQKYKGFLDRVALSDDMDSDSRDEIAPIHKKPVITPKGPQPLENRPWKEQVTEAESVIASLRKQGKDVEADTLDSQLDDAKAHKFFAEWMVSRQCSHVSVLSGDAEATSNAHKLHLDITKRNVLKSLQGHIRKHENKIVETMTDNDLLAELLCCGETKFGQTTSSLKAQLQSVRDTKPNIPPFPTKHITQKFM
eukprot:PhF_6_TR8793/c0_g1_i1/m.13961